ncbi:MAG: hypothetical protein AAGK14_07700 [Verrucomicrobiota bacterium]
MSFRFTVHYQEADDGVTAQIVQVPAAISSGATSEEALANVKEALALLLEAEAEDMPSDDRKFQPSAPGHLQRLSTGFRLFLPIASPHDPVAADVPAAEPALPSPLHARTMSPERKGVRHLATPHL